MRPTRVSERTNLALVREWESLPTFSSCSHGSGSAAADVQPQVSASDPLTVCSMAMRAAQKCTRLGLLHCQQVAWDPLRKRYLDMQVPGPDDTAATASGSQPSCAGHRCFHSSQSIVPSCLWSWHASCAAQQCNAHRVMAGATTASLILMQMMECGLCIRRDQLQRGMTLARLEPPLWQRLVRVLGG